MEDCRTLMSKIDVKVYCAVKMTGCSKDELVARAERVCEIMREFGITPISPVIEENVKNEPTKLINANKPQLSGYWKRDKQIIIEEAHVLFWDHAEQKSFGVEREYGLNRYCLWKPSVLYVPKGTPTSVSEWEDDAIFYSVHDACRYIVDMWGTPKRRRQWRWEMLKRTLPTWVKRQWLAWR